MCRNQRGLRNGFCALHFCGVILQPAHQVCFALQPHVDGDLLSARAQNSSPVAVEQVHRAQSVVPKEFGDSHLISP